MRRVNREVRMIQSEDEAFMRQAIQQSRLAVRAGNHPFGAALVKDGVLEHMARNDFVTVNDPTGHAEVLLLREAAQLRGRAVLEGATVYTSGEPCAMCAGALFWAGIRRVVYAATTPDIIAVFGGPALPARCRDVLAGAQPPVLVEGPLLRDEAVEVLRAGSRGER
jgi:tRNA(Arg) A34 adenosine deaminase TadA